MKRVQAMSSAITAMSHCTTAREKSWRHLNENAGITCNRPVDCDTILTIRRFAADDEIGGTNAEKDLELLPDARLHKKEGAAGIMGNIANEASTDLNPTLIEYGSTSRTSLSGEQ